MIDTRGRTNDDGRTVEHGDDFVAVQAGRNREPAAAGHRISRVQEEIQEHLLQLELEAHHRDGLRMQFPADFDAALLELVFEQREHVANDLVEINHRPFGLFSGVGA